MTPNSVNIKVWLGLTKTRSQVAVETDLLEQWCFRLMNSEQRRQRMMWNSQWHRQTETSLLVTAIHIISLLHFPVLALHFHSCSLKRVLSQPSMSPSLLSAAVSGSFLSLLLFTADVCWVLLSLFFSPRCRLTLFNLHINTIRTLSAAALHRFGSLENCHRDQHLSLLLTV